eukprot:TRINITY_DN3658_c0_g1_i1.p1 TRINITY_DN3658_c0_g1~~TRINITY_DN3658_c0_g1_i1.p1  ORF type:complete len:247 (+),score=104.90 TRINITY_DN3658_c0_g1_i1:80-820(+)
MMAEAQTGPAAPAEVKEEQAQADSNPFSFGGQPAEELAFIDSEQAHQEGGGAADATTAAQTGVIAMLYAARASVAEFRSSTLKGIRPWTEFGSPKDFNVPKRGDVMTRLTVNGRYYYSNYLCLVVALACWTALSNLFFVASMGLTIGAYYFYKFQTKDGGPLVVMGREVSSLQFYAALVGTALFCFWVTGGSSTIFWLIASVGVTIGGHATLREPVDAMTAARMMLEGNTEQSVDETFSSTFGTGV